MLLIFIYMVVNPLLHFGSTDLFQHNINDSILIINDNNNTVTSFLHESEDVSHQIDICKVQYQ